MYEAYLHEISLPPELVIKNFIPDVEEDNYEIAEILSERKTAGKAGPVR